MAGNKKTKSSNKRGLILFGLLFLCVGLGVLVAGPLETLYQHWRSSSWQQVPATLDHLRVAHHRGDDSTTLSLEGSYRYQYQGRTFHSSRIGYDWGSDNIGDYHRRIHSRLAGHIGQPAAVRAWVDPSSPADSYLVRELRVKKLLFGLLFGGVFAAVGLGIMFAGRLRSTDVVAHGAVLIHSSEKHGHWLLAFMALLFFGVSLPGTLAIPEEIGKDNWSILLVLLFPLAAVFMARAAWRARRCWQYFGPMPVRLTPYPGQLGGDVAGELPLRHYDPAATYSVTLQCVKSVVSGSGKNRTRRESIIWQDKQYPHIEPGGDTASVRFLFTPPTDMPVTSDEGRTSWFWRLCLKGPEEPVALSRTWTLPVVAGDGKAAPLPQAHVSRMARREKTEALAAVVEQVDVEPWQDGLQITSRRGRHKGLTLMLLAMGLIFTAATGFLVRAALDEGFMLYVMAFFFGLFGVPMLLGGLFTAGRALEARIIGGQVYTRRSWFGINLWKRQLPLAHADQLTLKSAGSMSSGTDQIEFFHLRVSHQGRSVRIVETIAGRDSAEALREQLVSLLRLE